MIEDILGILLLIIFLCFIFAHIFFGVVIPISEFLRKRKIKRDREIRNVIRGIEEK